MFSDLSRPWKSKAMTPDWKPFQVALPGNKADLPRSLETLEGVGDRLRVAAFAEIQAREAFLWATSFFKEASSELKQAWSQLAIDENRHLQWLLTRMKELQIEINARKVSDQLWCSLYSCQNTRAFSLYMASAEERGRVAGMRFFEVLHPTDPVTARIFKTIAEEEVNHIRMARQFFDHSRYS